MIKKLLMLAVVITLLSFGYQTYTKNAQVSKLSGYLKQIKYPDYMTADFSDFSISNCPIGSCKDFAARYEYANSMQDATVFNEFIRPLGTMKFNKVTRNTTTAEAKEYDVSYTGDGEQCAELHIKQFLTQNSIAVTCIPQ